MRLVQVTIPSGKRQVVLDTLDAEGVDYVVTDEISGREYDAVAFFPLPKKAVEPVLDALRAAGLKDHDAMTIIVDANTVVSERFEQLQEKYDEEQDEDRIAREELAAAASELAPPTRIYLTMTIVSALIAAAGLLLDSPAVVVGSMVIAPFIGPAMSASVGTVLDDQELFSRGVRLQLLGLAVAVVTAMVFALIVRYSNLIPPIETITSIPEIRARVAPDFLSLVVALGAGAAGVISLTSGVSTALVGVMIAVALMPPAATVGIGLAWQQPLVTLGSTVLLLVNTLSINLSALVILWYSGYRPERWFQADDARSATLKRIATLAVAIVVLSGFLGGVTFDSYSRAATTTDLNDEITAVVEEANGERPYDVHLLDIRVEQTNTALFQKPERLVVVLGVPPDRTISGLGDRIDTRAESVAGVNLTTEVRYIPSEVR